MISGCTVDITLEDQLRNLEVKQTSLENCEGEEGLFSKKKIEKGTTICTYWGRVMNE